MTVKSIRSVATLWRSEDGVAAIELAVVTSVLSILALGMIEYSSAIHQSVQLQQQARVGAEFAAKYPSNGDGIQQAITGATSNPSENLAVTVTQFCECPDGTSVDCSGTCAAGVSPDTFVRVNLAQPARTYLSETGLLSGHTLTAGATMRVK